MNEAELLAHALCDYLRPVVSENDITHISRPLLCGEPHASLVEALGVAINAHIALPPLFGEKILALPELNQEWTDLIRWQLNELPEYLKRAS